MIFLSILQQPSGTISSGVNYLCSPAWLAQNLNHLWIVWNSCSKSSCTLFYVLNFEKKLTVDSLSRKYRSKGHTARRGILCRWKLSSIMKICDLILPCKNILWSNSWSNKNFFRIKKKQIVSSSSLLRNLYSHTLRDWPSDFRAE